LTHEVENSGDGSARQTSEVQTVTFNAGRGIGGTATLTYNDLYGQAWTTRPFNVGGDMAYRLEVSIKEGTTCDGSNSCDIRLTFNGGNADIAVHAAGAFSMATNTLTAQAIRGALLSKFGAYAAYPIVGKDRGNSIYVHKHYSSTSVKLGGSIESGTRMTFDIYLPIDMSSHDDNGELLTVLGLGGTNGWKGTPVANAQEVKLYPLGDRSAEITNALTSLPNNVIPSVEVSKVGVTDAGTNSDGANGNAYSQSYSITFNNEANAGDQNILKCNAGPCDEDGCINRGPGASEVRYMHHDAENTGEGINFVNQGYFIMDIGCNKLSDNTGGVLSAGSIKIMWDTGAGIDSAIFATVATAAEVQTALRTISGWEGVTVALHGSAHASNTVTANHQFKVTFAAGYDDLGKSPTFYTMQASDGAYAAPNPTCSRGRLFDQRFSNSIWLGKTTGYVLIDVASHVGSAKHVDVNGGVTNLRLLPNTGDVWTVADINFGTGRSTTAMSGSATGTGMGTDRTLVKATAMRNTLESGTLASDDRNYAYLKEGATSVQTSDYFAVGATIEVLDTTYDAGAPQTDVATTSSNKYKKFKVTGHVTNPFNREFAKLDSFPADDVHNLETAGTCIDLADAAEAAKTDKASRTLCTGNDCNTDKACHWVEALTGKEDYYLKITNNNGTVHSYPDLSVQITVNEVQMIVFGSGAATQTSTFKLYMGTEETQDMDASSTVGQIAEEINSFSQLSGPVTVAAEAAGTIKKVTFAAIDGDVAQMTAIGSNHGVTIATRANGWSIEGPVGLGLDTMQAGGIINVTSAETCTFTLASAAVGYPCYDGVCGIVAANADTAKYQLAMDSIQDNNGDKILDTTTTMAGSVVTVVMPMGKSCDGLELRGTGQVTTKTVEKNNNGKQFKITRSFLQQTAISGDVLAAAVVTCGVGAQSATTGCHQSTPYVDSVLIADQDACGAKLAADGHAYPISRVVQGTVDRATVAGGHALTVATIGDADIGDAKCDTRIARHVITLDSMPTESLCTGTGAVPAVTGCPRKTLLYTSPVGGCSVTETTKGTYESYECSNRGACDGKSGLCTCYEGYSGQSCQTQTVLV
jgi:hypothetical protein